MSRGDEQVNEFLESGCAAMLFLAGLFLASLVCMAGIFALAVFVFGGPPG